MLLSDQKLSMVVRAIYGSDSLKIYHHRYIIKPAFQQNDRPSWKLDAGDYFVSQNNPILMEASH